MERAKIVAGNWKMHKSLSDGTSLTQSILERLPKNDATVILCTPYIHLEKVAALIENAPNVKLGAQNCHQELSGAYTGEISVEMLRSVGVDYVILGHSERRAYFSEDNALLAAKVDTVLGAGMQPIFCCGESLEVRESGKHAAFVAKQLEESLFHLSAEAFQQVVIAYEPIWAIGTGVTASPEQAQDMHASIRGLLEGQYGAQVAAQTAILYGGSVKPGNAKEIFSQKDVDGGLIGGASLKAEDFSQVVAGF